MSLIARFDGMAWPVPGEALSELEWHLRHDSEPTTQRLQAASVVAAYRQLMALPQRQRNTRVAQIRRAALAAPTPDVTKGEPTP